MKTKIQKKFVDHGFGFPVVLLNVRMVQIRGVWTPKVDYKSLQKSILKFLSFKPTRLTGNEIHFIRHSFEMTTQAFAKRFDVTHPAVLKWEKFAQKPTAMNWTTEKDIRLFILSRLGVRAQDVVVLYNELEEIKSPQNTPVEIDMETPQAA